MEILYYLTQQAVKNLPLCDVQSPSNFLSFIFERASPLHTLSVVFSGVECLALSLYIEKLQINKPMKKCTCKEMNEHRLKEFTQILHVCRCRTRTLVALSSLETLTTDLVCSSRILSAFFNISFGGIFYLKNILMLALKSFWYNTASGHRDRITHLWYLNGI